MTDHPIPPHPPTTERAARQGRRGRIALTTATAVAATLVVAFIAVLGAAAWNLVSCDSEFTDLSKALPDDPAVVDLRTRFPDHEDPQTGCDEDDNTASAGVAFRTGLDRDQAVEAAGGILTTNGWDVYDRALPCYTKQIRGREVSAELLEPDEYDEPGTDLVLSITTRRC